MTTNRYGSNLIPRATLLVLALAALWPVGVQAQEAGPTLESLTIELWPDFDREGVLVIYFGQFASGATPPDQISLLLPAGAELNAVAYQGADGNLLNAEYETQAEGDSTRVDIVSSGGNFWLEFYTPADSISREEGAHSFAYTWGGDLAVEQLVWRVQQPATASGLTVEPGGGQMETDAFNLPVYRVETGALGAGQTAAVSVTYQKSDDVLTASVLQAQAQPEAQPAAPAAEPEPASSSALPDNLLPIVLAVVGVALLAVGAVIFLRSGQERAKPARGRQAAGHERTPGGYCTNCGNALQPGDKFCRECGTPVER
jgi:hypothetical protein